MYANGYVLKENLKEAIRLFEICCDERFCVTDLKTGG